jgi:nucleoside-diphosphate-sugar epimerase
MNRLATEKFSAPLLDREGEGKRALITGLRGFTGYYLARELSAAGYRVFGTVLPGDPLGPDIHAVDLRDRDAVNAMVEQVQPDVVAHLAGIAFVAHENADLIYNVNVLGTRNLLAALARNRHQPSAVLLASSANIYGNSMAAVIDESVPPMPANDYAVSKLAMEHMAQLWADRLPIIIARPFNYTGVGQDEMFLLPKIVNHFRQHADRIELGNLAIARDFSDVRMVAGAYRRLLAVKPAGQAFNVCSGEAHSMQEVLAMMGRIAGYEIKVEVNPAFVRSKDVARLVGSNAKLTSAVGELPAPPLEETLRWMYQA